jgi:hypothetical protein
MQCKECEWQLDNHDSDLSAPEDPFIAEGLSLSDDSDIAMTITPPRINTHVNHLQAGKAHQENLKERLFCSNIHQARHIACSHAQ